MKKFTKMLDILLLVTLIFLTIINLAFTVEAAGTCYIASDLCEAETMMVCWKACRPLDCSYVAFYTYQCVISVCKQGWYYECSDGSYDYNDCTAADRYCPW